MKPRNAQSTSNCGGFIVVAVMWILIALATLASIFSMYVGNSAIALSTSDDRIQQEALVYASLSLTAYQLAVPETRPRAARGAFRFRLGTANIVVMFSSENARIDLNAAPKELLAGLFAVLGAPPAYADQYADRVIDWRTPPKSESTNNADAAYRAAGLHYFPRQGIFAHVNELWLVQGLPPALVERAMDYVTVYSGEPAVNLLDAAPEVIAALPGMTPGRLNAVLNQRTTLPTDPQFLVATLGLEQGAVTTKASKAVRVVIRVNFDKGRQMASEVVIMLGGKDEAFRVLSWRDDIDAATTPLETMLSTR